MDIDALKRQWQDRANLSPEQAEQAARVALEFFAERAPQVRDLAERAGGLDDLAKRVGGLFDKT